MGDRAGSSAYAAAVLAVYELKSPRPMAALYTASYLRIGAEYDATVEASGFDAVRVRYRQQRRTAIAEIVADVVVGDTLARRAHAAAARVPPDERDDFVEETTTRTWQRVRRRGW